MRNIKFNSILILFGFLFQIINSQKEKSELLILKKYLKNISDTILSDGFYKITHYYNYYDEINRNYRVDYNTHIDSMEIIRRFLFFKKRIKSSFVHSTSKIVDADNPYADSFVYEKEGGSVPYMIDPMPVALKENIIRIYEAKEMNPDSTYDYWLTLKLDFCNDSIICNNKPFERDCPEIVLVINNLLIGITRNYINEETYYGTDRYFVFIFRDQTQETLKELEKYKRILNNETLKYTDK